MTRLATLLTYSVAILFASHALEFALASIPDPARLDSMSRSSTKRDLADLSEREKWKLAQEAFEHAKREESHKDTESAAYYYEATLELLGNLNLASSDLPTHRVLEFQRKVLNSHDQFLASNEGLPASPGHNALLEAQAPDDKESSDSTGQARRDTPPVTATEKEKEEFDFGSKTQNEAEDLKPNTFEFETIPFGKTLAQVRALMGDKPETLSSPETNIIEHVSELRSRFLPGLYSYFGVEAMFNPSLVKAFEVTYPEDENLRNVRLFFFRNADDADEPSNYHLFLVIKDLRAPNTDYSSAFSALRKGITARLGVEPTSRKSVYSDLSSYDRESLVAIWTIEGKKVYLAVTDWATATSVHIIYLDVNTWQGYLNACKVWNTHEKAKKQEDVNQKLKGF